MTDRNPSKNLGDREHELPTFGGGSGFAPDPFDDAETILNSANEKLNAQKSPPNPEASRLDATGVDETRAIMSEADQPTVAAPIHDLDTFSPEYNQNEQTARGGVIGGLEPTLPLVELSEGVHNKHSKTPHKGDSEAPTLAVPAASAAANRRSTDANRRTKNVPPLQEVPEKHRQYLKLIGKTIDGYFIESLLGAGGMGAVYLAHQVSLDRKVAFKILPEKFSHNAQLLARFTREALSAAQLSHHNVMGVIDIGFAEGVHYISLEFVRGKNIGDITREKGSLKFDEAAGYILQASRGLAYAHDRGLVHRDIKPDNLMLNEHGVIKVADLGLAKMNQWEERPAGMDYNADLIREQAMSNDLTMAEVAMGTPAYMSPEQARDTAKVDGRSDQYSLGCTFYYLCAGRAPYSGTTAFELMTKHIEEPLIPITHYVGDVPVSIRTILERMLAKKPEDRYPTLHELAKDLEVYLGVDSSGEFKPSELHLQVLERVALEFQNAKGRALRDNAQLALLLLPPLVLIICLLSKSLFAVGFGLGLTLLLPPVAFLTTGILTKAPLYLRLKRLLFSLNWKTYLQGLIGALLLGLILWLVGWLWMWVGLAIAGVGLGFGYLQFIHRPLLMERKRILDPLQEVLKELRLRGLSEDKVQFFVMQFSGDRWEELYETIYDYDAKRGAREVRAEAGLPKTKRFGAWRDILINWIEDREEIWRKAREMRTLQRVETARLEAEGMTTAQAENQAASEVAQIMQEGAFKRAEEEKIFQQRRLVNPLRLIPVGVLMKFTQFTATLILFVLFFCGNAKVFEMIPQNVQPHFVSIYKMSNMNFAEGGFAPASATIYGLAGAVMMLLLLFSRSTFFTLLSIVGALAFVFSRLLIDSAGQQPYMLPLLIYSSLGLITFSLLCRVFVKITGGKY
ncbi:MAG: serine/threonine-protein kinase [Sumerlaeia bacterium]